jgi:hypothetical protein
MLNNFIYAQSKAMFEERLAEVPNEAIVFIEDTKEIWTHGTYFDCSSLDPNIIPNIQVEINELKEAINATPSNLYAKVNHGTNDTVFALTPYTLHK